MNINNKALKATAKEMKTQILLCLVVALCVIATPNMVTIPCFIITLINNGSSILMKYKELMEE